MPTNKEFTYADLNKELEDIVKETEAQEDAKFYAMIQASMPAILSSTVSSEDGLLSAAILQEIKAHTSKQANIQKTLDETLEKINNLSKMPPPFFLLAIGFAIGIPVAISLACVFGPMAIISLILPFACAALNLAQMYQVNRSIESQYSIVKDCQAALGLFSSKPDTVKAEAHDNQLVAI